MFIILKQLIALFPILMIGISIIILLISISYNRNHLLHFLITIITLSITLFFCFLIRKNLPILVTNLIYVDKCSLYHISLILISAILTAICGYSWIRKNNLLKNKDEFYLLLKIATIGGIVLSISNHLITLFIGIELMSLPLIGLIGFEIKDRKQSLESSIKYMLFSSISSSFLLFGISLIYIESGNLGFSKLGINLLEENVIQNPLFIVGIGMILISLGFKLSFFPFQIWTPDIYQESPIPILMFLITTGKISVFSVLVHLLKTSLIIKLNFLFLFLSIIAAISILFGNIMSVSQYNIKRFLGYSSISNTGYLLLPLISFQIDKNFSQVSIIIYFIFYLCSNFGILSIINILSDLDYNDKTKKNNDCIKNLEGLYWKQPFLAINLTIILLSFSGIPITLGFISKYCIMISSINMMYWWLIFIIIIGNIIGTYYCLRLISNLYIRTTINKKLIDLKIDFNPLVLLVLICTILTVLFGIWPQPLFEFATSILTIS